MTAVLKGHPERSREEFFNHLLEALIVPALVERFLAEHQSWQPSEQEPRSQRPFPATV